MAKKRFDYKKLLIFGGIPTCLLSIIGFIVISSKTITTYAELPKELAETKGEVGDIKSLIKEQQIIQREQQKINQYYYQKEINNDEIIYSQDGYYYWNPELQEWRDVRELEE